MISLGIGLFALLAFLPTLLTPYLLGVMILVLYYAYLGQSWNILGGYAGQLSLGHAAFFGIGAYTSTVLFLKFGITPWVGMFAGGILAMIIGLGLGYLTFKYGLQGAYFALATLAFAEILRVVTVNVDWVGGAVGFLIPSKENRLFFLSLNKMFFYYIILGMLILITGITYWIQRSRMGLYLMAIREDEGAADSLGIRIVKYKLIATAISAFFTALAGTFYAQYLLYIDPTIVFDSSLSVEIILRPIIGGSGTVWGPIIGSFVLGPLSELTRVFLGKVSGLHLMVYGAILMLVIKYMPTGIAGMISRGRR
jgi:branched-chain amino acid transport system permease protein